MASSAGPRPALLGPIVSKTNPDVKIPRIIYGTAWKKERTSSLVNQALKAGFRAVDTAAQPRHYNEALVGDGISRAISKEGLKREELYVSSSSPNHSLIQVPRMVVATMHHQCFVGTWYNYLSLPATKGIRFLTPSRSKRNSHRSRARIPRTCHTIPLNPSNNKSTPQSPHLSKT